jgi:hypothetical protein
MTEGWALNHFSDMTLVAHAADSPAQFDAPGSSDQIISRLIEDLGDFERREWIQTVPIDQAARAFMRLKLVEDRFAKSERSNNCFTNHFTSCSPQPSGFHRRCGVVDEFGILAIARVGKKVKFPCRVFFRDFVSLRMPELATRPIHFRECFSKLKNPD